MATSGEAENKLGFDRTRTTVDQEEFHRLLDDPSSTPNKLIEAYYKAKKSYSLAADSRSAGISESEQANNAAHVEDVNHKLRELHISGQGDDDNLPERRTSSERNNRVEASKDLLLKQWQDSEAGRKWQAGWDQLMTEKTEFEARMKTQSPMYSPEQLNERFRSVDHVKAYHESREVAIKKVPRLAEWYQLADIIVKGPVYAKRKKETEAKEAAAAQAKSATAEKSKLGKGKGKK